MKVNEITGEIIDASILILKRLGPGLLKSEYEKFITTIKTRRSIQRQAPLRVISDDNLKGILVS